MASFYDRLEKDIQPWRQQFMQNPLVQDFLAAEPATKVADPVAKDFMRGVYTRFLKDSYYHVRAAARVYALAGSRVPETDEEIREWLLHHSVEEYGHHNWIMDDLRALQIDPAALATSKPSVWCDALVGYMYYTAGHGNPVATLGDTYVIEGLSQLFASPLAGNLKDTLGIPGAVSYLAKHGEADQGHMEEFRELVDQHVRREQDYEDILQVSKTEFALYTSIVANLTEIVS